MLHLAHVLELVVGGLYQGTLSQQYLVGHGHQPVLHVVPYLGDKVYTVGEEGLHGFPSDISLVGIDLAEDLFEGIPFFEGSPIVHVGLGDAELQYIAPLVYGQVQFEPVEPSHGGLPRGGRPVEYLVALYTFVAAYPDLGGTGKGDTGTVAHGGSLQKERHGQKAPAHGFHEPVVGNGPREIHFHVQLYAIQAKVLEGPVTAQVEECHYRDGLRPGHGKGTF